VYCSDKKSVKTWTKTRRRPRLTDPTKTETNTLKNYLDISRPKLPSEHHHTELQQDSAAFLDGFHIGFGRGMTVDHMLATKRQTSKDQDLSLENYITG